MMSISVVMPSTSPPPTLHTIYIIYVVHYNIYNIFNHAL